MKESFVILFIILCVVACHKGNVKTDVAHETSVIDTMAVDSTAVDSIMVDSIAVDSIMPDNIA